MKVRLIIGCAIGNMGDYVCLGTRHPGEPDEALRKIMLSQAADQITDEHVVKRMLIEHEVEIPDGPEEVTPDSVKEVEDAGEP